MAVHHETCRHEMVLLSRTFLCVAEENFREICDPSEELPHYSAVPFLRQQAAVQEATTVSGGC